MNISNKTIDYYNKNASKFYTDTIAVSFSTIQDNFVKYLPEKACILDFGCGSGRDSFAFQSKGYLVDAIDGSEEMCKLTEKLIGKHVPCVKFQDFQEKEKYDGIWACASLLHLEHDDLYNVFKNLHLALKENGYLYASFKYSNFQGLRNDRYFHDMTEDAFTEFIKKVKGFETIEMNVSSDVRLGREEEKWINIILRKSKID